jgi:hypothetical protein
MTPVRNGNLTLLFACDFSVSWCACHRSVAFVPCRLIQSVHILISFNMSLVLRLMPFLLINDVVLDILIASVLTIIIVIAKDNVRPVCIIHSDWRLPVRSL